MTAPKLIATFIATTYNTVFILILIFIALTSAFLTTIHLGFDLKDFLESHNIKIGKFYIRYDDGFIIKLSDFQIPKLENNDSSPLNTQEILTYISMFESYVKNIEIDNLYFQDINISANYSNNNIYAKIKNIPEIGSLELNTSFITNNNLLLQIEKLKFNLKNIPININGNIGIENNLTILSLYSNLGNSLKIHLGGELENFHKLKIKTKSIDIKSLEQLFTVLDLSRETFLWGVKKTTFKNATIYAETEFNLSEPAKALDNLKVIGELKNVTNKFEENLDRAEAENINIVLKNGNLYIESNSIKYGQNRASLQLEIKKLFKQSHLYIESNIKKLNLDKHIYKTIKFYSNLNELPINIGDSIAIRFLFSLPLYETKKSEPMKFIVKANISNSKISNSLDNKPLISSGVINYSYPQNIVQINNNKLIYNNLISANFDGYFDISKSSLNINGLINNLNLNKELDINLSKTTIKFDILGDPLQTLNLNMSPTIVSYQNKNLDLKNLNFKIKTHKNIVELENLIVNSTDLNLSSNLFINYNYLENQAIFNIHINSFDYYPVKIANRNFNINMAIKNENLNINIPTLETSFDLLNNKWNLTLNKLSKITSLLNSEIKIPKIGGNLNLKGGSQIEFFGDMKFYDQKILKSKDDFIENINISGIVNGDEIRLNGNNQIFVVSKKENIKIWIDGYDFNISGLDPYLDTNSSNNKQEDNQSLNLQNMIINLKNGRFYFGNGNNSYGTLESVVKIGGESIFLQSKPFGGGLLMLQTLGNRYLLRGTNLKGSTINELSDFNGLSGGDYNLFLKGVNEDFDGLLQFGKLKIKDMQLVNNILAFINTVPALLTFSQPGFNHNGLRITAGYLQFNKKGDIFNLQDIKVDGESVDISGSGKIDLKNKKIDLYLDISAIKYIDKVIENIPIANYLILGEDGSISTRIHISGDLDNPDISTDLAKEIVSTPFEIGKRAFNIPLKILIILRELNINDNQNRENINEFIKNIDFNLFRD